VRLYSCHKAVARIALTQFSQRRSVVVEFPSRWGWFGADRASTRRGVRSEWEACNFLNRHGALDWVDSASRERTDEKRSSPQSLVVGNGGVSVNFNGSGSPGSIERDAVALQRLDSETVAVTRCGREIARNHLQGRVFREDLGSAGSLDLAALDRRPFLMGALPGDLSRGPYGREQHFAESAALFMGRTALTQDQRRAVADWPRIQRDFEGRPSCFVGTIQRVECLLWHDARAFCARRWQHQGSDCHLLTNTTGRAPAAQEPPRRSTSARQSPPIWGTTAPSLDTTPNQPSTNGVERRRLRSSRRGPTGCTT
jgi:hypothetical protein